MGFKDQFGTIGESVRLKCKIVSGMDDNTISWDVNGKPLKVKKNYNVVRNGRCVHPRNNPTFPSSNSSINE